MQRIKDAVVFEPTRRDRKRAGDASERSVARVRKVARVFTGVRREPGLMVSDGGDGLDGPE
jgi:hypothetical protein